MNKKKLFTEVTLIFVALIISACGPSQADIEKAISQTETARPTATPTITYTLSPTPTNTPTIKPTATKTPTPTIDIKATQLSEARAKENYSSGMKEILGEDLGCILANWKDNSFELVCLKAVGWNEPDQLITIAYTITSAGGIRLANFGLGYLFEPGFSYVVIIMSDDGSKVVRATTDGETMRMLVDKEITSQLEWEVYANIEVKSP